MNHQNHNPGSFSGRPTQASDAAGSSKSRAFISQSRFAQSYKHHRYKDEAVKLFGKFQLEGRGGVDREGVWKMLREIDPDGKDPLPCNYEWAWKLSYKSTDELLDANDITLIISKYESYVDSKPHIAKLIQECDVNSDGHIDHNEMHLLLERACGQPIDLEDVMFVIEERNRIKKNTTGMVASSPDVMLKAIATWWCRRNFDAEAFNRWKISQRKPQIPPSKPKPDFWEDITRVFACCAAPVPALMTQPR